MVRASGLMDSQSASAIYVRSFGLIDPPSPGRGPLMSLALDLFSLTRSNQNAQFLFGPHRFGVFPFTGQSVTYKQTTNAVEERPPRHIAARLQTSRTGSTFHIPEKSQQSVTAAISTTRQSRKSRGTQPREYIHTHTHRYTYMHCMRSYRYLSTA